MDCYHIDNCNRIDFVPEKETISSKDNWTTNHRSLVEKVSWNDNIATNTSVDGVVENYVFWEVLTSEGWQRYLSKISKQIEKMYQKIKPEDVEKVDENYESYWWLDSKFDDIFVYHCKHHQISPLFMLQRNMN